MIENRFPLIAAAAAAVAVAAMLALAVLDGVGSAPERPETVVAPAPAALPQVSAPKAAPVAPEPPADMPGDLGSMVLVPGGEFIMGSDTDKPFEKPRRTVHVDSFYIDKYEVTNWDYSIFTKATGWPCPPHWTNGSDEPGFEMHPVVNVTFEDALEYARWAGKRLPTEAEWEKACRGIDGRKYAYGDEFDPTRTNWGASGICETVAVYEFPDNESPYGCRQMTGNAWEWVADWFAPSYDGKGARNPRGPGSGILRISKGGSWTTDAESCRASYKCRSLPGSRWGYCGFRCAGQADASGPSLASKSPMTLIPEGWFLMGSDKYEFTGPRRRIWLDAYRIDTYPVTNAEYADFCDRTRHPCPPHWNAGRFAQGEDDHPVVNVTIDDARAYARFAGKRLPNEAQWEKAARGEDGREYPWGDEFDPSRCNTEESGIGHTVEVGRYPGGASPFGVMGMCGNAWQWVEGWYGDDYYKTMPERNPPGPQTGRRNVLRGGTWSTFRENCTTYFRCMALPGCRWGYCGFRCVGDAD